MRTTQVSAFVYHESPVEFGAPQYLALLRDAERGGFWQSVTGGVEEQDGPMDADSTIVRAAIREVREETGMSVTDVLETGYSFSFPGSNNGALTEHVVAAEVDPEDRAKLSDEHTAGLWVSYSGLRDLITARWPENGESVDRAHDQVRTKLPNDSVKSFGHHEWSFVIVKPDAVELGIQDEIDERMAAAGLETTLSIGSLQLDESMIDKIWLMPPNRDAWYNATAAYMMRTPVDIKLVAGQDASAAMGKIKADLRFQYDKNHRDNTSMPVERRVESVIHCSDRMEELVRQSVNFFGSTALNDAIRDRYGVAF